MPGTAQYRKIFREIDRIFAARNKKHKPGKKLVNYAASVIDEKEIKAGVASLIDGWFGLGEKGEKFENMLASFIGCKGSILANSGSSANLLAVGSIMSPLFLNHLRPGDEVITAVCGFPTTVNPLVFYGLVPVFLDVEPETYNIDADDLEKAYSPKTKAVFLAHTLGNPNDMDKIVKFCREKNLLLLEDNCDALGSEYAGQKTGSFGILSTQSFYPPHHITMGEGGAINFQDRRFDRITHSLRDWGRSCWCRGDSLEMTGACGNRFNFKLAGKPYDHKYLFNQIGFNLKPIEAQAAMGIEQMKKLPGFVKKRKRNFAIMHKRMKQWEEYFILPKSLPKADPCWFAFPLTIRENARFNRHDITLYLEKHNIQTRPLFAGNILRQPAYANIKHRKIGRYPHADLILHNTFMVGIYPGLSNKHMDYIAEHIENFVTKHGK